MIRRRRTISSVRPASSRMLSAARRLRGRDRLDAQTLDDSAVCVNHERLALLLRYSERRVAQASVNAEGDRLIRQRVCKGRAVVVLPLLAEFGAQLDFQAALRSDRLDRLHAAHIGARQDASDRILGEPLDECRGLSTTLLVQRPK